MKAVQFEFTPEELNLAVYQAQEAEVAYQKAKDDYEILRDSSKDVLGAIMSEIEVEGISEVKLERKARKDPRWIAHKAARDQAKQKLGEKSTDYNHAKRVIKAMTTGISMKREMLAHGIVDQ